MQMHSIAHLHIITLNQRDFHTSSAMKKNAQRRIDWELTEIESFADVHARTHLLTFGIANIDKDWI